VLAVLSGLLESGAGAVRGDALAAESNRHLVRVGVGALDASVRVGVVQVNFVDNFALFVVEASQKGASPKQATKAAVGQSRECVS
jgi:hypothetical protein